MESQPQNPESRNNPVKISPMLIHVDGDFESSYYTRVQKCHKVSRLEKHLQHCLK